MAIIAFEIKDLKGANRGKLKLDDVITKIGVEVEKVSGTEITLNITPNRPDLLDFVGMQRAIENFTWRANFPASNFYKITNAPAISIEAKGKVKNVRPYIAGIVIKNVNLSGNRLRYLINFTEKFAETYGRKRKKLAIGIHNLDSIDGNLTYSVATTGTITPLGSSKPASFDKIMKENAKGVTYQDTVPNYGSKNVLYPFLKDSSKAIALIPITNCDETKITEKTKNVFIDITGTSANAVRSAAAVIACSFIYAEANVYPVEVKYDRKTEITPVLEYQEIKISMAKADNTIGAFTGRHNVINLANKMGYSAAKYGNNVLFYVPPYRVDVLNDQDIIEDVAIAFGYDNINPTPVSGTGSGMPSEAMEYENKLAYVMLGLGYTEAMNSVLTNEDINFKSMRMKGDKKSYVNIADAKTITISMLRTAILPSLLQNLAVSANATMPQRIFEVGKTFSVRNDKARESTRLGFASIHSKANFAEVKGVVEAIFKYKGEDYKIEPNDDPAFIPGRCARITVGKEPAGIFGEIHPEVLKSFKIEEPVVAAEITL